MNGDRAAQRFYAPVGQLAVPRATGSDQVRDNPDPTPARHKRQAWWPLLADDLFRVAHDDYGARRLRTDVTARGLAAALIAELVLTGRATVTEQGLLRVLNPEAPIDVLANGLLTTMREEPEPLPVRTWMARLADDAIERVGRRMTYAGLVRPRTNRVLGTATLYVPADIDAAAAPWRRLSHAIDCGAALSMHDTVLLGLIMAMNLHRTVLAAQQLRRPMSLSSAWPEGQALLHYTEAAVGDTVNHAMGRPTALRIRGAMIGPWCRAMTVRRTGRPRITGLTIVSAMPGVFRGKR